MRIQGTTILAIHDPQARRAVVAADGQATMNQMVIKAGANKIRTLYADKHRKLDGSNGDSFPVIDLGGGVSVEVRTANGVVKGRDRKLHKVACGSDENCRSIGTLIRFGKFRMWTSGDLTGGGNQTPDVESVLAQHIGKVDIYRANHHGSKTSSNSALLGALQPQVVIISAGRDNRYCHPHASVLSRFLQIPAVALFLTTAGIANTSKCGPSTTRDRLAKLGKRSHLATGTLRITALPDRFTLSAPHLSPPLTWKVRP